MFLRFLQISVLLVTHARGQVIVSDNYNVAGSGTGFALGTGVNSGINPPATRLVGVEVVNLRYLPRTTAKANSAYSITGNKLRVTPAAGDGVFFLSADGTVPFNFAEAVGATAATPANPAVYELSISMANQSAGSQRCSFAIGTTAGSAGAWNFGIQIFRTAAEDNFYTIQKRISLAASGVSGLLGLDTFITNTPPGTYGTEINLLLRVTDAGAETAAYHSRVQLSMDNGLTWFYDTETDPDLVNGWRFQAAERYVLWHVQPDAGEVTFDNFSLKLAGASAQLVSPADHAGHVGAPPALRVSVTNTTPGNLTVTYFGHEPAIPGPGPDFLLVLLPDAQNYAQFPSFSDRWYAQTEWIVTNRVRQNIAYVGQLGDLVQNGDVLSGNPNSDEWRVATNAMYRLENPARTLLRDGIPYGCCVGNHDQEPNGDPDGTTTLYNQYFGVSHFTGKPYYGGRFGSANKDNFYNLFSAGGLDFIVFSLEYGRYGSAVLDWVEDVIAAHPTRRILVMTHYAAEDCGGTSCAFSDGGQAIYDRLKSYPNFFLMLGGHVFTGDGAGEGMRSSTYGGNTVHTLVSDYQQRGSGGNGLLRLLFFSPSNNTVSVKTYSPYTRTYETDASSQFSFAYNMKPNGDGSPGTAWVPLGTNANVAPGADSTLVWSGGQPNKTYEWYVKVTDAFGNSVFSPAWRFTTTTNAAPVATNRVITITGDQPSPFTLFASDANGDSLSFQTNSAPLRGLVTAFSPASGAVTYTPAHGMRGLDQFTFSASDGSSTSSIATVILNIVAPADSNANGLPDAWEAKFGVSDPNGDPDGDGQSNLAEYIANTNPTNAASLLQVTGCQVRDGVFTLTWSAVGGTRYRVQRSDDLSRPFTDLVQGITREMSSAPGGAPSTLTFSDSLGVATTNHASYYRVKVSP